MGELDQQLLKFDFNKNYKKDDYFVSKSNYFAFTLIDSWPRWESKILNICGEKYSGKQVSFQPFLETELKNRVSRYKTKKFIVTMS